MFLSVCEGLDGIHNCAAGPMVHNDVKVRGHVECFKGEEIEVAQTLCSLVTCCSVTMGRSWC